MVAAPIAGGSTEEAEAAVRGLFAQSTQKAASRAGRMVWVFVALLLLLAALGFYVFWYVMCYHKGGSASGLRCRCGPHGKYNFFKFGCVCNADARLLSGGGCTVPTSPPPDWRTKYTCANLSPNDSRTECCLPQLKTAAIVGAFCGDTPSTPEVLKPLSAPGHPRFSPTAQDVARRYQPQGWLT